MTAGRKFRLRSWFGIMVGMMLGLLLSGSAFVPSLSPRFSPPLSQIRLEVPRKIPHNLAPATPSSHENPWVIAYQSYLAVSKSA
ncbi:MAG: hypothetical protein ACOY3K_01455 [Candidatus Omnitrophota bacterium]